MNLLRAFEASTKEKSLLQTRRASAVSTQSCLRTHQAQGLDYVRGENQSKNADDAAALCGGGNREEEPKRWDK